MEAFEKKVKKAEDSGKPTFADCDRLINGFQHRLSNRRTGIGVHVRPLALVPVRRQHHLHHLSRLLLIGVLVCGMKSSAQEVVEWNDGKWVPVRVPTVLETTDLIPFVPVFDKDNVFERFSVSKADAALGWRMFFFSELPSLIQQGTVRLENGTPALRVNDTFVPLVPVDVDGSFLGLAPLTKANARGFISYDQIG